LRPRWRGDALRQAPNALQVRVTGLRHVVLILVISVLRIETSLFFVGGAHLSLCARPFWIYDVFITESAVIICHWVFFEWVSEV
jgi:hypothetical protein